MRYLRVYWALLKTNAINSTIYRANFFVGTLITALETLAAFYTIKVLFNHVTGINDWSYPDMLVLSGAFFVANGISWFTFRAGVDQIDQLINKGDFDSLLTKPINSQFLVSIYRLDVEDSARGLVGLVVMWYGLRLGNYDISFLQILLFVLAFIAGEMILYSIQISLKTISFKSLQGWATNNIFYRFQELNQYPMDIYRGFARVLYTALIPLLFVTTVPVKILLGKGSLWLAAGSIIAAIWCLFISRMIWKFAVKHYSSASS